MNHPVLNLVQTQRTPRNASRRSRLNAIFTRLVMREALDLATAADRAKLSIAQRVRDLIFWQPDPVYARLLYRDRQLFKDVKRAIYLARRSGGS